MKINKQELVEWMTLNWYITDKTSELWLYQTYINYAFEHIWLEDDIFLEVIDTGDIEYLITIWTLYVWDFGSIQIVLDRDAPMFYNIEWVVDYICEMYDRLLINKNVLSSNPKITCTE